MTLAQRNVLQSIGDHVYDTPTVAAVAGVSKTVAAHVLDGLFRRSLVTMTPSGSHWMLTDRGRGKIAT